MKAPQWCRLEIHSSWHRLPSPPAGFCPFLKARLPLLGWYSRRCTFKYWMSQLCCPMGRQPLSEKIPEVDQGHNLLWRHVAEKFPHWLFLKFTPQVPKCIDDGGYGKSYDTLQNTSTSSPQHRIPIRIFCILPFFTFSGPIHLSWLSLLSSLTHIAMSSGKTIVSNRIIYLVEQSLT